MPSSHLILCRLLLLLPWIFPNISLFKWVSSSHQVAKILEFQLENYKPTNHLKVSSAFIWIANALNTHSTWSNHLDIKLVLVFQMLCRSCKIISSLSTHCLLFYELWKGCCLPVAPALGSAFRFISFRFVPSTYFSMDREAWQAAWIAIHELQRVGHDWACTHICFHL